MFDKRLTIFTGHFGSGKTEVAVNYTLQLAQRFPKVAIMDLDIVNPFFRTADVRKSLEDKGIYVITPNFANTNTDVPSLPPEINMLFGRKEYKAVLDVGGDDLGAKVLSTYNKDILQDDYEMYFVINIRRPMTFSELGIEEMIWEIESSSRLKVTKLVNNTNLLGETTADDFLEGTRIISDVSRKLGIPVGFASGFRHILEQLPEDGVPRFYMDKYIKLPWDLE